MTKVKNAAVFPALWKRTKDVLVVANFIIIQNDLMRSQGFLTFPIGVSQACCIINQKILI